VLFIFDSSREQQKKKSKSSFPLMEAKYNFITATNPCTTNSWRTTTADAIVGRFGTVGSFCWTNGTAARRSTKFVEEPTRSASRRHQSSTRWTIGRGTIGEFET